MDTPVGATVLALARTGIGFWKLTLARALTRLPNLIPFILPILPKALA